MTSGVLTHLPIMVPTLASRGTVNWVGIVIVYASGPASWQTPKVCADACPHSTSNITPVAILTRYRNPLRLILH